MNAHTWQTWQTWCNQMGCGVRLVRSLSSWIAAHIFRFRLLLQAMRPRWLHLASRGHPGGSHEGLALLVIPPRSASRELPALETAMQGLIPAGQSAGRPIALELVGTSTWRGFVLRAAFPAALRHLAEQIRARYPQAELRPFPVAEDPWHLAEGEVATAVELRPGTQNYLPLRTWPDHQLVQEGTDPLLGLLAAFGHLPPGSRVIAQLALALASEAWSLGAQRLAVEHPLDPERARERWQLAQAREGSGSTAAPVVALALLLGLVEFWLRAGRSFRRALPAWLWQTGSDAFHGRAITLTPAHGVVLIGVLVGLCALVALAILPVAAITGRLQKTRIYDMKLVGQKTTPIAYHARLHVFVIGPGGTGDTIATSRRSRRQRATEREEIVDRLIGAYRQFHLAAGSYFVPSRLRARCARRMLSRPDSWMRGVRSERHLLSVADVAGLWHLPQAGDLVDLPLVERSRARTLLAPPLPIREPADRGLRLGVSSHAGHEVPVCLPVECLRRNALAVAKTGKGKSTLLLHLARSILESDASHAADERKRATAITFGKIAPEWGIETDTPIASGALQGSRLPASSSQQAPGLVLIDPHGDLVAAVLGVVPLARRDDTILVDLADRDHPVGLNPLDVMLGRDRDKAVENLLAIFAHVWGKFWGPRMENALEFALKTLYEANEVLVEADPQDGPDRQYTLLDVAPLLSLPSFRHGLMGHLRDPALLAWWRGYYEPLDRRLQLEIINPVLTKMAKFSSSRVARRIVGQGRSTLNLADVVRQGRLLLVHTARGIVGTDTAALVGATLLGLLHVTLAEQAGLASGRRRPVYVVIDEFQTIPGADYAAMLSELRKFGGSFALATQALAHLDALDRTLRPTVLANVDHLFAFATSAEDARLLERELDSVVEVADLTNLDDFTCYAKLTLGGQRLPVFSLALDPPPEGDPVLAETVRVRSRQRYAQPVETVDAALVLAAARHAPTADRRSAVHSQEGTPSDPAESELPDVNQMASQVASPRRRGRGRSRGRGTMRRSLVSGEAAGPSQLSMLLESQLGESSRLPSAEQSAPTSASGLEKAPHAGG